MIGLSLKTCNKCGETYLNYCKPCSSKRASEWNKKNKKRYMKRYNNWAKENPDKIKKASDKHLKTGKWRERWYQKKYGISYKEYLNKLKEQDNCCALCGSKEPKGNGNFCLDHDHDTKQVRGILCNKCNIGLGSFNDNPVLLQRAIDYLFHHDIIFNERKVQD